MIEQIFADIDVIGDSTDNAVSTLRDKMPENTLNSLTGIFPEWFKTLVMITIAMISSAVISLAKSQYSGVFKFSIWVANIVLSMVMAFLVDTLALWIEPELNIRAEMILMVLTGMLAKDLLELAEHRGLNWIKWRANDEIKEDEDRNG